MTTTSSALDAGLAEYSFEKVIGISAGRAALLGVRTQRVAQRLSAPLRRQGGALPHDGSSAENR